MSDLPIDLDKVRAFLDGKRERTRRARTAQAHNPRRIYQWGSLVETGHFTELSDIDIALEGIRRQGRIVHEGKGNR